MPLPLILGVGAAIAGITGVGSGAYGAVKMKEANDTMKSAERQHKENIDKFERYKEAALITFIGIPLPTTGVWTGTAIATFLKLDLKSQFSLSCFHMCKLVPSIQEGYKILT